MIQLFAEERLMVALQPGMPPELDHVFHPKKHCDLGEKIVLEYTQNDKLTHNLLFCVPQAKQRIILC
jgi:hypothetical protein